MVAVSATASVGEPACCGVRFSVIARFACGARDPTLQASVLPLAVQGSGLYSPLAIVIIGGLVSSTLLGRLVTPVMYKMLPPPIAAKGPEQRDAALA